MPSVLPISRADVEKYTGKWVVVDDDHVVFASERPDAAFRWAAERGIGPERGTVVAVPRSTTRGWFL